MSADRKLGYPYAPVPRWVFELRRERLLADTEALLLQALFHLAALDALMEGRETPSVSLDRLLLEYVDCRRFRRRTDRDRAADALRKRLERGQARGLFSYRVVGNAQAGYRYVFKLVTERPDASVLRPTATGGPRPRPAAPETRSAPTPEGKGRRVASDRERTPSVQSRPISDASRPTTDGAANPPADPGSAGPGDASRPSPSDVRSKSKALIEEERADVGEGTYTHERARGPGEGNAALSDATHAVEPDPVAEGERLFEVDEATSNPGPGAYGGGP